MDYTIDRSNAVKQALIGGIAATVVMTIFTYMAPLMGMPEMNPPEMLSGMLGVPIAIGWVMHFMIGVVFALSYAFLFLNLFHKIESKWIRGILFGIAVFIFAQIMMLIMGALMGGMAAPEGNMMLMMIGSLIGHIVYGIVVALIVK